MSDRIVYSTESGDLREKSKNERESRTSRTRTKNDGIVRVQKESKGRGGKTVSVVYGLPLPGIELSNLAAKLKRGCGAGGSVKDRTIIIQGDKVEFIIQFLQNEGFAVKRAGGN